MAGRAGRRGIDTWGNVYVFAPEEVPSPKVRRKLLAACAVAAVPTTAAATSAGLAGAAAPSAVVAFGAGSTYIDASVAAGSPGAGCYWCCSCCAWCCTCLFSYSVCLVSPLCFAMAHCLPGISILSFRSLLYISHPPSSPVFCNCTRSNTGYPVACNCIGSNNYDGGEGNADGFSVSTHVPDAAVDAYQGRLSFSRDAY